MFETQKSGDKTSSGETGLNIRTFACPKMGQDQVSGGVSVPCWHATPVADAPWKPIFSNVKFNKNSNQGKGHESVVTNQGKESNSVSSQIRESWIGGVMYDSASGLSKITFANQSQMGQDQVPGGVSVLCWHAAPVANITNIYVSNS